VPHVCGIAGFLDGVKCNASSVRRDRRKNSVGDLFLVRSVKIGEVNGIVALERNVPIGRKCSDRKAGERETK